MAERNIVVIGCSVGGVEALQTIAAGLPENFHAAVFIVLHVAPQSRSVLPDILNRVGPLPAKHPIQREQVRGGHIYIAPPDHHMIIEDSHIILSRGPKENRHRPSVDPLFRSAARAYGRQVIGIVLTGSLDDGTVGLQIVKKAGGVAIVQDPNDAFCADMPRSAIDHVKVDHIVPLTQIAALLAELVPQPVASGNGAGKNAQARKEIRYAEADMAVIEDDARPGTPSQFACPDCGGVLWELEDEGMLRFRCRVGHAYGAESLLAAKNEELEGALWTALRTLEEKSALHRRLAEKAQAGQNLRVAKNFRDTAEDMHRQAQTIRSVLLEREQPPLTGTDD